MYNSTTSTSTKVSPAYYYKRNLACIQRRAWALSSWASFPSKMIHAFLQLEVSNSPYNLSSLQ